MDQARFRVSRRSGITGKSSLPRLGPVIRVIVGDELAMLRICDRQLTSKIERSEGSRGSVQQID